MLPLYELMLLFAPAEVQEFHTTDVHSNLGQTMETYKNNKQ